MKEAAEQYTNRDIIDGIRHSRSDVLKYVYKQFYPMIYSYIINNSGNKEEARDIFQDGIIVLYEKSITEDFELTANVGTFLYSVCQRLWLNKLNRQKNREFLDSSIPVIEEEQDVFNEESNERQRILNKLFNKIGESCRKILIKKYFEKRKDKEIAEELNLSGSDYVKMQRYRCLKQLRKLYNEMKKESK